MAVTIVWPGMDGLTTQLREDTDDEVVFDHLPSMILHRSEVVAVV